MTARPCSIPVPHSSLHSDKLWKGKRPPPSMSSSVEVCTPSEPLFTLSTQSKPPPLSPPTGTHPLCSVPSLCPQLHPSSLTPMGQDFTCTSLWTNTHGGVWISDSHIRTAPALCPVGISVRCWKHRRQGKVNVRCWSLMKGVCLLTSRWRCETISGDFCRTGAPRLATLH